MFFQSNNRFVAYSPTKEKVTFQKTYDTIEFENSTIGVPRKDTAREAFAVPAAVIEQGVALGYTFLQDQLRKRLEKFVYQYQQRAINLHAGSYYIPNVTYSSNIYLQGRKEEALRLRFEPVVVRGTNRFVYQLAMANLKFARAKTSKWSDVFDYTIQMTLYFLKNGSLSEHKLEPIVVQSVPFGDNDLLGQHLYTSSIVLEENCLLLEAGLTIVETNPAQINTTKILNLLSENKDTIQTKIASLLTQLLDSK